MISTTATRGIPHTPVRIDAAGRFIRDGEPWLPRGINSYPLLQHAAAQRFGALREIFAQARALRRPLVRTPAFLDAGAPELRTRDARGIPREPGLCALDRALALAADSGVQLLLISSNHWPDFGGAPALLEMVAPGERLPVSAFYREPRAIAAQLAFQHALARRVNTCNGRRYAEDPTIFAWELTNEARCHAWLGLRRRGWRTLAAWAKCMSDGLRGAGVQQLIAWGGCGQLGRHGEELRVLAADGGVDVLTLHMYGTAQRGRPEAAIVWGEAALSARSELARSAGKALLLEEVNWSPAPHAPRDAERARVLAAWLRAAHALGIGTLPWMIGEAGRTDHDGYLIRPEDTETARVLSS